VDLPVLSAAKEITESPLRAGMLDERGILRKPNRSADLTFAAI
jgi:hypothetical protein